MNIELITKLEKIANELFGKKSVVSVADVKFADKGYVVRINMQGMPFEISSMHEELEVAEGMAFCEFEKQMRDALENTLFPTQSVDKYTEHQLTDQQYNKLFKFVDTLSEDYLEELKKDTVAKMCRLDDGRYECVIESPYMCLHARGRSGTTELAILSATMSARSVFNQSLVRVGKKPWKN